MATESADRPGFLARILGRKAADIDLAPANMPLGMLERLNAGERPDYCLYLRPAAGGAVAATGLLSIDIEDLTRRAFDPLPVVTLDESSGNGAMPDEAFLTLANNARVLLLVPTADIRFLSRLRLLQASEPLGRAICLMPENGTLGGANWPETWTGAREAAATLGLELSSYTAGGWLFRLGHDGKACTFRPIVNPNPDKIAKALEAICAEMR